ncbi:MAG: hypothetical protein ACM3O6_12125 [Acidobacteriota bacterium]
MKIGNMAFATALLTCAAIGLAPNVRAQETMPEVVKLANDSANAKMKRFDHIHGERYLEIFLIGGNRVTGDLRANVYNTTSLNGWNKTNNDSAPEPLVEGLDLQKLAKQNRVFGVYLNGPKLWAIDWFELEVGKLRNFGGLKAPWVANVDLKGLDLRHAESNAYKTTTIERKSRVGWNKGTKVFLIDDADGNTWVLKGIQLGLRSTETYESITANFADTRLKNFPQGWKFRTKVLERDLIEHPEHGVEPLLTDAADDIFDRTGPGYTNYKP